MIALSRGCMKGKASFWLEKVCGRSRRRLAAMLKYFAIQFSEIRAMLYVWFAWSSCERKCQLSRVVQSQIHEFLVRTNPSSDRVSSERCGRDEAPMEARPPHERAGFSVNIHTITPRR